MSEAAWGPIDIELISHSFLKVFIVPASTRFEELVACIESNLPIPAHNQPIITRSDKAEWHVLGNLHVAFVVHDPAGGLTVFLYIKSLRSLSRTAARDK